MRIQQHSAYPHSRFRWAKFLGTCCTMAARHRSDTTQCRTAGKLATWTLEVSVWKNGKTWKRDFRKKVSTNSWSRITKTPMGRRDGKVQRVCVPVSSWLSCCKLFFYLNPISVKNQEGHHFQPAQATKHTFYSECVEINMETLCTMNPIIA